MIIFITNISCSQIINLIFFLNQRDVYLNHVQVCAKIYLIFAIHLSICIQIQIYLCIYTQVSYQATYQALQSSQLQSLVCSLVPTYQALQSRVLQIFNKYLSIRTICYNHNTVTSLTDFVSPVCNDPAFCLEGCGFDYAKSVCNIRIYLHLYYFHVRISGISIENYVAVSIDCYHNH